MATVSAVALFRAFHGRAPDADEVPMLDAMPSQELVYVGTLDGIMYTSVGDGNKYVHKFAKADNRRPRLFVTADGKQIYTLAGGYKFTERGFIG